MSQELLEILESAAWEVKPNPVLKTELMIVEQKSQYIIATVNLANFDEDEVAYAYAELIASAPQLRNKILRLESKR
jgi:hypothetical protein